MNSTRVDPFLLIFTYFGSFQFNRFSNLQTRSSFTVVEGVWALGVQSLPQGKPRNDACSLPLTSDLSLLPSLPLLSFLSPNSQKSNLYPGLFPFLSVLLKTFNVTICLNKWACVRGCVRAPMMKASHVPMSVKIMCACTFCVRELDFSFSPVSDHSSRGKVKSTVCVCTVTLTEALEAGTCEKLLTWWIYQQTPASWGHTYLWKGLFSLSSVL